MFHKCKKKYCELLACMTSMSLFPFWLEICCPVTKDQPTYTGDYVHSVLCTDTAPSVLNECGQNQMLMLCWEMLIRNISSVDAYLEDFLDQYDFWWRFCWEHPVEASDILFAQPRYTPVHSWHQLLWHSDLYPWYHNQMTQHHLNTSISTGPPLLVQGWLTCPILKGFLHSLKHGQIIQVNKSVFMQYILQHQVYTAV